MKRFILMFAIIALITSCKTQQCMVPLVVRDSISITYKQGKEQPAPSQILCNPQRVAGDKEQPASLDAIGAAIESRKNSCVPADGSVGVGGATQGASVFEGLLSQRTNKKAVPPTPIIRVDTVFVERWHTTEVPSPPKPIPRFYKDCTWGFFILLLLTIGRIALRIAKAIYQQR